ncbi:tail fibers protein [Shewanella phage Thanatos-1]|nr:tail fibers protein [Shewanella phage Thanatos-1]
MADLTAIQFLRTSTAGKLPTAAQLHEGALAINLADRTIYTKNAAGQIIDLGFGKGGSVNGSIDATGTVKAGKLETALADLATANITTLNVTNLNNTGLTNIANSLKIYGVYGNEDTRLTLSAASNQTAPIGIYTGRSGNNNTLSIDIGSSRLATLRLSNNPTTDGYTSRFDIPSMLWLDGESRVNRNMLFRQPFNEYALDLQAGYTYSGSGDANGLNYLLKTRGHNTATPFYMIVDSRSGANEITWSSGATGPSNGIWGFGVNYFNSRKPLSVGFTGASALGDTSIAIGVNNAGLALSNNAIHTFVGGASMANVSSAGILTVLRSITGLGTGLTTNNAIFKANTDSDGNAVGDGVTHIGYKDSSGNFNHYFRGKGSTNIDTHAGLIVNYDLFVRRNASISGVLNAGTLTGSGSSTSYKGLTIENISAGWSYIELKALNAVAHIALKTEVAEGAVANSLHLRPNGQQNGSLIIQPAGQMLHLNQYGSVSIGALNGQYAHFNTSNPQFYFYKDIVSGGNFYAEGGQKVFHQGFLPTLGQLGAMPSGSALLPGNDITAYYGRQGLQVSNFAGLGGAGTNGVQLSNPVDGWHHHITLNHANSAGYYVDIAASFEGAMYIKSVSNGSHSGWARFYTTSFKPTPNDIGAISTSGNGIINGNLSASNLGVNNTSASTGYGLSLYGGANTGMPSYGISFSGTPSFGTHGSVIGDWATYFTMTGATNRGWIFKTGNGSGGNIASISASGVITASSFVGSGASLSGITASQVGAIPISGLIATGQIGGTGNGDLYTGAGIETRSSGAATPSIGFHKPGSYAGTLRMLNSTTFGFLNQDNSSYADLTVRNLTAADNVTGVALNGTTYVTGGRIFSGWDSGVVGSISCSQWFRSSGATGWFSDTYGGGIWMKDDSYVRVYAGKKFAVESGDFDSINTIGGIYAAGSISSQSNITAVGDLSTQRNVGCTGDVYARSFYGNANIGGTGSAINCPGGIYSQGTNWLYGQIITNNSPINAGSGVITGNGSGLSNLQWNNIVGKPNEVNSWINVYNSTTKQKQISVPTALINHLNNGGAADVRVLMVTDGDGQKCVQQTIFGGGVWTSGKYKADMTWSGLGNLYLHNSSSAWGATYQNKIDCRYTWITRVDYRLL